MFQAVFSWATVPMDAIKAGMALGRTGPSAHMAEGPLRSLLVDGVIAGAGGVLVFPAADPDPVLLHPGAGGLGLPAARRLLAGHLMGKVGLSGALSFRCCPALPAPCPASWPHAPLPTGATGWPSCAIALLMTCSARLPVYALLIGAFIPGPRHRPFNLRV